MLFSEKKRIEERNVSRSFGHASLLRINIKK